MRYSEIIKEELIEPSSEPNTMSFWHGGDLSDTSMRPQKKGRFEYGAGLYLITRYDVAAKYAKGSRKLYKVDVRQGNDSTKSKLDADAAKKFVNTYVKVSNRREILQYIDDNIERVGALRADTFNNIILNSGGIKSGDTVNLSNFMVSNDIDYEIITNPFGWGQAIMMVLYSTNKIVAITRVMPKDKITQYDLPIGFN